MNLLLSILKFFIKHLLTIHKGTVLAKIKSSVIIGLSISPVMYPFEGLNMWLIDNVFYLKMVLIALFADLLIGVYVHAEKFKDFSLREMVKGFLSKAFLTGMGLVLFEVFKGLFNHYNVSVGDYFKLTIALIVISYPLFSAFGNLSVATDGKFPPIGWMNRIKKFQENLNPKDLITKEQTDETY